MLKTEKNYEKKRKKRENSLQKEEVDLISKNVKKEINKKHMKIKIPINYKKTKIHLLDDENELNISVDNLSQDVSPKIQHFESIKYSF
jgi:hypothetical protein